MPGNPQYFGSIRNRQSKGFKAVPSDRATGMRRIMQSHNILLSNGNQPNSHPGPCRLQNELNSMHRGIVMGLLKISKIFLFPQHMSAHDPLLGHGIDGNGWLCHTCCLIDHHMINLMSRERQGMSWNQVRPSKRGMTDRI